MCPWELSDCQTSGYQCVLESHCQILSNMIFRAKQSLKALTAQLPIIIDEMHSVAKIRLWCTTWPKICGSWKESSTLDTWIAVTERYFLIGGSYWGSNFFSISRKSWLVYYWKRNHLLGYTVSHSCGKCLPLLAYIVPLAKEGKACTQVYCHPSADLPGLVQNQSTYVKKADEVFCFWTNCRLRSLKLIIAS